MNDFDELGDNVKVELDRRKLGELVKSGAVTSEDIANAPILSVSECCGADMIAEPTDPIDKPATCDKCGKPCWGAEK